MLSTGRILMIVVAGLTPLTLVSCGDGGDEAKVEITQIPRRPTVINSNFTIDPTPENPFNNDEIQITGPWFPIRFSGKNGADRDLTIASFNLEITARGQDGNSATADWSPDLGLETTLLKVPAGETFERTETLYVDGLPQSSNKTYRVKMTFEGWFHKKNNEETDIDESLQPEDSFQKVISFITQ